VRAARALDARLRVPEQYLRAWGTGGD